MKYRLLDILRCPYCKEQLEIHTFNFNEVKYENSDLLNNDMCPLICKNPNKKITRTQEAQSHCQRCYNDKIMDGLLSCNCGKAYPIVRGIPRFLPDSFDQHPEFTKKYYD